ncbi:MAG: hypothetical protein NTU69_12590 [Proteobacteria bacterium]|nr:hypothetical protein [Pseudomonadota bacterium]
MNYPAALLRGSSLQRQPYGGGRSCTWKAPIDMLKEENLKALPAIPYKPCRVIPAVITTTAFIEFETNRYSIPTEYAGMAATILSYPDHIEVLVREKKVAYHTRSFDRRQKIEHPSHRERLLQKTSNFKYERIQQLMKRMDAGIGHFLTMAESEGEDPLAVAYGLFKLLKRSSKAMLTSAVREANALNIYKLRYIESLLTPRMMREDNPVYPQNAQLLAITYTQRELSEYDELV